MFENAKDDLIDALSDASQPIPVSDARSVAGDSEIVAEGAINNYATVAEQDGEEYVVAVEGGPQFTVNDLGSESDSEPAETDETPVQPEADQDPSPVPETDQRGAEGQSWAAEDGADLYDVNGITTDTNPSAEKVGEPTGNDWEGIPKLTNGNARIPNEPGQYIPIPVGGGRTTQEIMGRVMGVMRRPLLFEGEAGTGKNTAFDVALFETNRSKYRVNFGSDVSVFDLVGEKDLIAGESYYILGKLAKAAVFGGTPIFDEVNMVSGDVSSFIHGVTEDPGNRSLELRGVGRTLTDIPVSQDEIDRYGSWYEAARAKWDPSDHLGRYIHPEFLPAATCNPITYADTKSMNAAFRDRFVVIEHPYLTSFDGGTTPSSKDLNIPSNPDQGVKMEAGLLADATGADEDEMTALVDVAALLRESREQTNVPSCPITHRTLLKTVELAGSDQGFMPFKDAFEIILQGHAQTKNDKQYVADTIEDEL